MPHKNALKIIRSFKIKYQLSKATDGARSKTGKNKRETTILQSKINHKTLKFYCLILKEALCAQLFRAEIVEVMNLVIKIVNIILSKAL